MFAKSFLFLLVLCLVTSCSPPEPVIPTSAPTTTRPPKSKEASPTPTVTDIPFEVEIELPTPTLLPPLSVNSDWSNQPASLVRIFSAHDEQVRAIAFSPQDQLVASGGDDQKILVWNLNTGDIIQTMIGHQSPVTALVFSSDVTLLVSGGWDNTVRLWNTTTGEEIRVFEGHESPVSSVDISPDNKTIASGGINYAIGNTYYTDSGQLFLWDLETGNSISGWHLGEIKLVSFFSEGMELAALTSVPRAVFLSTAPFDQSIESVRLQSSQITTDNPAFSPDGNVLVGSIGSRDITFGTQKMVQRLRIILNHLHPVFLQ